jgi:hypothetical protein
MDHSTVELTLVEQGEQSQHLTEVLLHHNHLLLPQVEDLPLLSLLTQVQEYTPLP